jgi:Carboxypeptidase regulatory-like domain/TonB dependent receptor-like, beta-barrel
MKVRGPGHYATRTRRAVLLVMAACALLPPGSPAQGLTGALFGTVTDAQGRPVSGAVVRMASTALIGGPATATTAETGHVRFSALPPGAYVLEVVSAGLEPYHENGIVIGAGSSIERTIVMQLAGVAESIVVEGTGSRVEARHPGFSTRYGPEELRTIPTRRSSMFDFLRAAPGISPTSPSSGTVTTVSAFGSGTNENAFLIDGTNFTCPCNGVARSEPGVDFIQEIQIQSVGASAEFGNLQGAVINVLTRQGGDRFLFDGSYYVQTAGLTSQPVRLVVPDTGGRETGYERVRYRDLTASLGGPIARQRLWFFAGYQHLRDYDSQPGADPAFPRRYEQDKIFTKLTWRLAPAWTLVQSLHHEWWSNPEQPTVARPFEATLRIKGSVPAVTFGHLTHTLSPNTVWDVRAGRFVFAQESRPATGSLTTPGRTDAVTRTSSGAPAQFGDLTLIRTTGKATLSHYRPRLWGADHEWKIGGQVEKGEHRVTSIIPSGARFMDRNGNPSQRIARAPFQIGGQFVTASVFVSDAVTMGSRLTATGGLRFDHSRAVSQDLHAVDLEGRETSETVRGLGRLYTWNVLSPRLGITAKLSADGRTVARASYGRFHQGVMTGEIDALHPGGTPVTTTDLVTGRTISVVDPKANLRYDPNTRSPFTDEYTVALDRELAPSLAAALAFVGKRGRDYIGWTDAAGQYRRERRSLADGSSVPVWVLDTSLTPTSARRFLVANQADYFLRYEGLVLAVEKRRSRGWQASGSYTLSRAAGLQPSNFTAAGAQVSTISPPTAPTFGRDPNDLIQARGRLANDRPQMLRLMASIDVARTGVALGFSLQHLSGKPWAATALVNLPQNNQQRVQLEPRGARRLPSQTLLDLRLSRTFALGRSARVELLVDALNLLDESAGESLVTDTLATESLVGIRGFGEPNVFVDPRRAMIGARFRLGR